MEPYFCIFGFPHCQGTVKFYFWKASEIVFTLGNWLGLGPFLWFWAQMARLLPCPGTCLGIAMRKAGCYRWQLPIKQNRYYRPVPCPSVHPHGCSQADDHGLCDPPQEPTAPKIVVWPLSPTSTYFQRVRKSWIHQQAPFPIGWSRIDSLRMHLHNPWS